MAEYIEREALKNAYLARHRGEPGGAYQLICEVPAADVEQVTRCKDCFQSVVIGAVLHCTYWCKDTDENGYCHEGG